MSSKRYTQHTVNDNGACMLLPSFDDINKAISELSLFHLLLYLLCDTTVEVFAGFEINDMTSCSESQMNQMEKLSWGLLSCRM